MTTGSIAGILVAVLVFGAIIGGGIWVVRKVKGHAVTYSVASGASITNGQTVTGVWNHKDPRYDHGNISMGVIKDASLADTFLTAGLSIELLDASGKKVKKVPATVTSEKAGKQQMPQKMLDTNFSATIDTSDVQKGPGFIRLVSALDGSIGTNLPVVFQ